MMIREGRRREVEEVGFLLGLREVVVVVFKGGREEIGIELRWADTVQCVDENEGGKVC